MRTKNQELLERIQEYIEERCDKHGYGPTVREIADKLGISSTNTHRYIQTLVLEGRISRGRNGYESNALDRPSDAFGGNCGCCSLWPLNRVRRMHRGLHTASRVDDRSREVLSLEGKRKLNDRCGNRRW